VPDKREAALSILQLNVGFDVPELWVDYAIHHGFRRVKATRIIGCPDCGATTRRRLAQFVYYSTLLRLMECEACGLAWVDARIDPDVLRGHFEKAYKDDIYFLEARRPIFQYLARLIDQTAPARGTVLDVGGAKGHLMQMVALRRPDLRVAVNDISESATKYAAEHFGFATITGDICALQREGATYDVIVLSDVLYYEPRIATMWSLLPRLIAPRGSVLIRVPNKLRLIRTSEAISSLFGSSRRRAMQTRIRFFNPEHLFVLSRRYLTTRLQRLGFAEVDCLPSPPPASTSSFGNAAKIISFHAARLASLVSGRRLVGTPSMILCARYYRPDGAHPRLRR